MGVRIKDLLNRSAELDTGQAWLAVDDGTVVGKVSGTALINELLDKFLEAYKSLVGTPLVALLASDMTDEEKIYVYTGNEEGYTAGHWYYYDETWNDGGAYNSTAVTTDKTLSVSDAPADSKKVGDKISEIIDMIPDIDTTLTVSGDTADAKVVGDKINEVGDNINDLKDVINEGNADNLLKDSVQNSKTQNKVTWTRLRGYRFSVISDGQASSTSTFDLYNTGSTGILPDWAIPGNTYKLRYNSTAVQFRVMVASDPTASATNIFNTLTSGEFTIPQNTAKLIIRLAVSSGTAVNEIVAPGIWNTKTNKELATDIENLTSDVDNLNNASEELATNVEDIATDIENLSDIIIPDNNPDLFKNLTLANASGNGINWEWQPDGSCHVTGTLENGTFINMYSGELPTWLNAGKTYYLSFSGNYVRFRILFRRNSTDSSSESIGETRSNDRITLPDQIYSIIIRLAVVSGDSGAVIDEYVHPQFFEYKPDYVLTDNTKMSMDVNINSPSYYDSEIEDVVSRVKMAMTEPCLTFIWCTDIHYQSVQSYTLVSDDVTYMTANMKKLANRIRFDGLICTGDVVDAKPPRSTITTKKQIDYVMSKLHGVGLPLIYAMGNHDDNRYIGVEDSQTPAPFSTQELYGMFMSYVLPNRVNDITMNGLNYYFDNEQFKIRFIVLDSNYFASASQNWKYGYSTLTLNWFRSQLQNVPTDYSIIVLSHTSPVQANNYAGTYTNIENVYNAISDYISGGGKYICTLYGHSHVDYSNTSPWLEITLGSAKSYNYVIDDRFPTGAIVPERILRTPSEELFDILIIKPNSRAIQTIRFGAGNDRAFTY